MLPIGELHIPTIDWEEKLQNLSYVEESLLRSPAYRDFHCGEPKSVYYLRVFDGRQKEGSLARGPKLGELVRNTYIYRGVFRDVVDFADGL